jgi:SAM-dependent methyltransferase
MTTRFFPQNREDDDLEQRNGIFWDAMIGHIRRDGFSRPPARVLDIGCHRGGLLAQVAELWRPHTLVGIEPIEAARSRALLRLQSLAPNVVLLDPAEWSALADRSIDLIVCHEVLFLIPDLQGWILQIARVLSPHGRAYLAAGCHGENPLWAEWRAGLEEAGISTFTHAPLHVMALASRSGLRPAVRPLRDNGWALHDPLAPSPFTFPTVQSLLDHQFRHKLLFRLARTE